MVDKALAAAVPHSDAGRSALTGLMTANSPYYMQWDACYAVVSATVNALSPSFVDDAENYVGNFVTSVLQRLLNYTPTEPMITGK